MSTADFINEKAIRTYIENYEKEHGRWPAKVPLRFSIDTEIAVDFFREFNSVESKRKITRTKLTKHDLVSILLKLFSNKNQIIDFSKNIYEQIMPGLTYELEKGGKRGPKPKLD